MAVEMAGEAEGADAGSVIGDPRDQSGMVVRHRGFDAFASNIPRPGPLAPSVWSIIVIAGIIALLAIIDGTLSEGVFLALLAFMVLGSLAPVVFAPIGLVVIVVIFYKGSGPKIFGWLNGLSTAQPVPTAAVQPVIPDKTFTGPGPNGSVVVIPNKTFGGS